MVPVVRLLRDFRERLFGTFYEGPLTPIRLLDEVERWATQHPKATRLEWATFARQLGDHAYREGYVRGSEQLERDPDYYRALPVELETSSLDDQWRDRPPAGPTLENPEDLVEESYEAAPIVPDGAELDPLEALVRRMNDDIRAIRRPRRKDGKP